MNADEEVKNLFINEIKNYFANSDEDIGIPVSDLVITPIN